MKCSIVKSIPLGATYSKYHLGSDLAFSTIQRKGLQLVWMPCSAEFLGGKSTFAKIHTQGERQETQCRMLGTAQFEKVHGSDSRRLGKEFAGYSPLLLLNGLNPAPSELKSLQEEPVVSWKLNTGSEHLFVRFLKCGG